MTNDPGPQRGPASIARIHAQTKSVVRELNEIATKPKWLKPLTNEQIQANTKFLVEADWSWPPKLNECHCEECNPHAVGRIFFACQKCGNKRCPKCVSHKYKCTGSNAPGQKFEMEDTSTREVE